ncbi:ABC transporter permease family protein [Rhodopirellula sallentina]|uniref:Amino-acid ABC transporter permease protein Y4TF n=1 Tax=Rhodopirellula sallentina SM41 TaxID=1263870 RepID=M5TSG8_9BACT|nr:amino-acid ABC transporter permease Y4TF [Rhodopirellula sallentina]EMI51999.1 amino-acid ABC transporter permease protein Y4TF [Rhodopirellula sallentina SM41]
MNPFANDWTAAIATTFALMAVSSAVAVVIGIPSAACAVVLRQSHCSHRGADVLRRGLVQGWFLAMLFSIVTPLILHAAVWESTAGKFGWLMKTMTGGNLFWVGWIHGVHGAAIVAVATYWATLNIEPAVIKHAEMDFGRLGAWFRVRLPLAFPWLLVAVVIVWLLAATEMSVADLHSVRTVADQFYLFYSLDPNFTAVSVTTWLPMLIGGVPALVWMRLRNRSLFVAAKRIGGEGVHPDLKSASQQLNGFDQRSDFGGGGLVAAVGVLVSVVVCQGAIVAGLVMQSGHSVRIERGESIAAWSWDACVRAIGNAPSLFASEYAWTFQLAVFTSLAVTPVAWAIARVGRGNRTLGWAFDCLATVIFLVPGPIVGLVVVKLFACGLPLAEKLATQTLVPTILSVGIRSGVIAYFIIRVAYRQIDPSVWNAGRMELPLFARVLRVEVPLLWPSILAAFIITGVVASGDVPATLPVLPPGVTTVGTRLFGLLHSGSRYHEASLAFWYLVAILSLSGIAWRVLMLRFHR